MKIPALIFAVVIALAPAAAAQTSWPAESPPRPLPAHEVQFPPYEIRTLPNGLQVVTVLHHEQPAVSMRMLIGAGSASDPKGKLGLAHLLASLLDQGTTTRSAKQLNDDIDSIGGAMGAGAFAERARHELLATGETVRRITPDTRDALTPQEVQVALLVRDGHTNPEIGAQLFISPRTVEYHLRKVFRKLDVGSRKELRAALMDMSDQAVLGTV